MSEEKYTRQRQRMVQDQIRRRGVRDERVLAAMGSVPRHCFVSEDLRKLAYDDRPLLIGEDQTISQPYVVALMTELLRLQGDEVVLEVGTGSGYQAAVLAALVKQVYSIERHQILAEQARRVLAELGIDNVAVVHGDGSGGLAAYAPYDGILVTAAAPEVPKAMLEQLKDGGRLVVPVGGFQAQFLELWQRKGPRYEHDTIAPVAFVPLRGQHGWEKDWYNK